MRVKWEVEDGYAGKARPHWTDVSDEELAECEIRAAFPREGEPR